MPKIPRQDLLDELQRLADELGKTPTTTDMNEQGEYSALTYYNRFGSWNEALEEINLEPTRKRRVTDEELREELKRLAEELGHTPTPSEMVREGNYHSRTYIDRFGSWEEALDEVDLELDREGYIPTSDLLAEINRLADEVGRAPTTTEMDTQGKHSTVTYRKRFESWDAALEAAGLEPPEHPLQKSKPR